MSVVICRAMVSPAGGVQFQKSHFARLEMSGRLDIAARLDLPGYPPGYYPPGSFTWGRSLVFRKRGVFRD